MQRKKKNLLSSLSKTVTSAPLFALAFIKQSHPAARVITKQKRGKTGEITIILQLYNGKKGGKITNVKRLESSIPYFGSGGGETTCRRAALQFLLWTRVGGNGGKEMKIRYVFILLIIIVLALFKKMAD